MGILDRISTLIKSNLNSAIDSMTDPGKEIDQLVIDMEQQGKKARDEVKQALATEKLARTKLDELGQSGRKWSERAEQAVKLGDDALATEALKQQAKVEQETAQQQKILDEQSAYVDKLQGALKQLDERIREVKGKKETLKAKARASKGQGTLGSSAFSEFERLSSKVDTVEAEAELDDQLAAERHDDAKSREADRRLDALGKDQDLSDRLAALKAKLDKK